MRYSSTIGVHKSIISNLWYWSNKEQFVKEVLKVLCCLGVDKVLSQCFCSVSTGIIIDASSMAGIVSSYWYALQLYEFKAEGPDLFSLHLGHLSRRLLEFSITLLSVQLSFCGPQNTSEYNIGHWGARKAA